LLFSFILTAKLLEANNEIDND
jgi:dynein heavy chain